MGLGTTMLLTVIFAGIAVISGLVIRVKKGDWDSKVAENMAVWIFIVSIILSFGNQVYYWIFVK